MTKIQSIYAFFAMLVSISVAAFAVSKFVYTQQGTDADMGQWMKQQEAVHSSDSSFKVQVIDEFEKSRILMDSTIKIGLQNQQAIGLNKSAIMMNRSTIIQQIELDTSLSKEDAMEMMKGLYEGIEELKKKNTITSYDDL